MVIESFLRIIKHKLGAFVKAMAVFLSIQIFTHLLLQFSTGGGSRLLALTIGLTTVPPTRFTSNANDMFNWFSLFCTA